MKKLFAILSTLLMLITPASAVTTPFTITSSTTFTTLHTYFLSATGCSDANAGTSSASPWCTLNSATNSHAIVCGDVIVAAAGDYSSVNLTIDKQPTGCASVSGGIDGTGGIFFAILLCGGVDLESCHSSSSQFTITASNWAVEGFKISGTGTSFAANACASGTTIIHHVAFINDESINSGQGYETNECALNHNAPGNGVDYFYVVASIAQNSAQDPICLGAIDVVAPSTFDTLPGTHFYLKGNFSWSNLVSCAGDGEGIFFDTWDAHGVQAQGVMADNVVWKSQRQNINLFYQGFNPSLTGTTWKIYNNTLFDGNAGSGNQAGSTNGDIQIQSTGTTLPYNIQIQNNISLTNTATVIGGTAHIYALQNGGNYGATIGGSGTENIFKGLASSCDGTSCDGGNNVTAFNGGSFGTNTYINPSFTNTSDLLTNRSGAPNCTGFENVVKCMGWDAVTSTLTTPSVISDLTASCVGCSGKGYRRPSMSCQPDSDFPTSLKGIVYLHWTGTTVQQKAGVINMPCRE